MNSPAWINRTVAFTVFQLACAPSSPPVMTPLAVEDSIPEWEIQREMGSLHSSAGYPILLGLVGAVLGTVAGAEIGYETSYRHDIQRGCEDCGLSGLLLGGYIGLAAGAASGVVVGAEISKHRRRAEAIRRIKARRREPGS